TAKPKPTIRVNPQSSIYTGDTITLSCELQETGWEIQWYKNNQQLQPQNSEQANTLNMTVINAEETEYKCRARRRNYKHYYTESSDPVKVTARECFTGSHKAVVSIKPDTHVFIGETVTLRCEIQNGRDIPKIYSWYKNKNRLTDRTKQTFTIQTVRDSDSGYYTCGETSLFQSSDTSEAVTMTVSAKPKPTISVNPQSSVYTGDTVTLSCELQSTGWKIQWYKNNQQLQPQNSEQANTLNMTVINAEETEYKCRARRGNYRLYYTEFSDPVKVTAREHAVRVKLSVLRKLGEYNITNIVSIVCIFFPSLHSWSFVLKHDSYCVLTERPQTVLSVSPQNWLTEGDPDGHTPYSNPQPLWITDGDVILESSVHPVTEGHPLTLHCLYHNTNPSNLRADFYKDGSVVQNQTTGEMILHKVSKSDEGFYHCKHPERGESPRSWISVRRPSHLEAPFSVLMLISSVVTASPYLLITIILLVKCYRARGK
ncbi:Fc receptor-like protein 5, partial [Silurus meridionalis]